MGLSGTPGPWTLGCLEAGLRWGRRESRSVQRLTADKAQAVCEYVPLSSRHAVFRVTFCRHFQTRLSSFHGCHSGFSVCSGVVAQKQEPKEGEGVISVPGECLAWDTCSGKIDFFHYLQTHRGPNLPPGSSRARSLYYSVSSGGRPNVEDGGNRSCSRCQALFQACHAWWRCAHERFGQGSA